MVSNEATSTEAAMPTDIREGTLLWEPSAEFSQSSNVATFMRWLAQNRGLHCSTYEQLWEWSIRDLEGFWTAVADFSAIVFGRSAAEILPERGMPGARWFVGAEINYARNVFRHATPDHPAVIYQSETRPLTELSWAELSRQVASVAAWLREMGVQRGDRVVAYMPNMPETLVAFLAAASMGAIWASCSPDFGLEAVLDRFAQIEPTVLFAIDGYSYGGKVFDRLPVVGHIQAGLPTLTHTVLVPYVDDPSFSRALPGAFVPWAEVVSRPDEELRFESLPFDHPLWVLYSSGTTGLPKALVHGHGGVVLEHVKAVGLQSNVRPGDRIFWYTSTGWMMWNFIIAGLLVGATPVLYDGSPAHPGLDVLWQLAESARLTLFGTSAAYIATCLKAGLTPGRSFDLSALRCLASTGSPLPPEGFGWVYSTVKRDLWFTSVSGGTDVVSAFVTGCPLLPVHAGELQCRALGAAVDSFDDLGQSLVGQTGELVITQPMPSMPVFLWNDPDSARYRASYFDVYPGVWRHGDWIKITDRGSAIIQGRSDSTLNRYGVRIGTSEIYSAIERLPEVRDSLVIGLELPHGGYYLPLFVVLADGIELDDALKQRINSTIRTHFSPRHVPDEIFAVPAIPRTLSDKKMEVPVKKLFMGVPIEKAATVGATKSPQAVEHFAVLARHTSPLLKPTE